MGTGTLLLTPPGTGIGGSREEFECPDPGREVRIQRPLACAFLGRGGSFRSRTTLLRWERGGGIDFQGGQSVCFTHTRPRDQASGGTRNQGTGSAIDARPLLLLSCDQASGGTRNQGTGSAIAARPLLLLSRDQAPGGIRSQQGTDSAIAQRPLLLRGEVPGI
jgi:hypothetical protein